MKKKSKTKEKGENKINKKMYAYSVQQVLWKINDLDFVYINYGPVTFCCEEFVKELKSTTTC